MWVIVIVVAWSWSWDGGGEGSCCSDYWRKNYRREVVLRFDTEEQCRVVGRQLAIDPEARRKTAALQPARTRPPRGRRMYSNADTVERRTADRVEVRDCANTATPTS